MARIGLRNSRGIRPLTLGLVLITVTAAIGVLIFYKQQLEVAFSGEPTITARFSQDYGIVPYGSQVKMSGIDVGTVTAVDRDRSGPAMVTMRVGDDIPDKLRSRPSARIRPTTLLGGNYYIDLVPGGPPGRSAAGIPRTRTTVPVEMDKITRTLQPDTLRSLQGTVRNGAETLDGRGRKALQDLLADAHSTLTDAGPVFTAVQGNRPGNDLPNLVDGLEQTGAALTRQQGQLDSITADLDRTGTVLGNRSQDLAGTLHKLPATLDSTDSGLAELKDSLVKLRETAGPARPAVRELNTTLAHLDPALTKARPVVGDLKNLLTNARPLVDQLTPTAKQLSPVLDDLRGPVLDRLNGPVTKTVLSPYHGTGHYKNSGGNQPLYKQLAYTVAGMDRLASVTDKNGATIGFGIGVSAGTVSGLPISLEQLLGHLTGISEKGDR
ncbi:MlaD family protein [Sciscionella marina]|uniref:MlaD family protein n=1 Tax=Sciscionella marina TaxID=508770 RepID=UPI00037846CD|nr:MlaD family protein [Sciscionella marina]